MRLDDSHNSWHSLPVNPTAYNEGRIERISEKEIEDYISVLRDVELNAESQLSDGFIFQTDEVEILNIIRHGVAFRYTQESKTLGVISGFNKSSPLYKEFEKGANAIDWQGYCPLSNQSVAYVFQIAVVRTARNSKIAISLWNTFKKYFPNHTFVAAIIEKPVANLRSKAVLTASGFERVGQFNAIEFKGLKNYQSGVYFRKN